MVHEQGGGIYLAGTTYPFIVGTAFQESYQMVSKEKEQLQTELDTTKRVSRAKDQQIAVLEATNKVKMTSLSGQFDKQHVR